MKIGDYNSKEKFVVSRSEENNNTNIYAVYYFLIQNLEDIYERKYKMLQYNCGSIEGIIKIIMLTWDYLNVLNNFYNIM